MVEQQYYTRERGGLFNQTDGYDTIAKSPQLRLEFIKKYLHPLCNYDLPTMLQKSAEEDESKYPKSFVVMPVASGEMIIGEAVYRSKDFTGLRSTFFMHNYILSTGEKRRYVKEPEKLFGVAPFATAYDIAKGQELPTLAATEYADNPYFRNREGLLKELGLSEQLFEKLVLAVFMAISSKRKIIIALKVPLNQMNGYAKALLYHLYTLLPWHITQQIGAITFAKGIEAKKGLHISFIEPEALQQISKSTKDYVVDCIHNNFTNFDFEVEEPYLAVAKQFAFNKLGWEKFNSFVEQMQEIKEGTSLELFNQLAVLFEMSIYKANNRPYPLETDKIRKGLLSDLVGYVKSRPKEDLEKQLRLLMNFALDNMEKAMGKGLPMSLEEVKAMVEFKFHQEHSNMAVAIGVQFFVEALQCDLLESRRETELLQKMDYAKSEGTVFRPLFTALYAREDLKRAIAYPWLAKELKGITALAKLIAKMKELEPIEEVLFQDEYYRKHIKENYYKCLEGQTNKVAGLMEVQRWCALHSQKLYQELLQTGELYFLDTVALQEDISNEDMLCKLHFSQSYERQTYETIMDYQRLKTDFTFMNTKQFKLNGQVQSLVKKFYKNQVGKQDFYMLIYGFLVNKGSKDKGPRLAINKVLEHLYSIGPEIMLDFIVWTKGQELYINKVTFDQEVVEFFRQLKKKKSKISKELLKEKLLKQPKTTNLYQKIKKSQQSALVNFIEAQHKKIMISGCSLVVIIGLGVGGYYVYESFFLPEPVRTFSPELLTYEERLKLLSLTSNPELRQYLEEIRENAKEKAKEKEEKKEQEPQELQEEGNSTKTNENKEEALEKPNEASELTENE